MKIIEHWGKTYKSDLQLSFKSRGVFLTVSKLDIGLHFDLNWWTVKWVRSSNVVTLLLGPVDIMWLRW